MPPVRTRPEVQAQKQKEKVRTCSYFPGVSEMHIPRHCHFSETTPLSISSSAALVCDPGQQLGSSPCFGYLLSLSAILHERLADVGPLRAIVHSLPTPTMSSYSKLLSGSLIMFMVSDSVFREFSSKDLKSVGNYTLGRLIGKGSFGKVYLASHKLTNGSKVRAPHIYSVLG